MMRDFPSSLVPRGVLVKVFQSASDVWWRRFVEEEERRRGMSDEMNRRERKGLKGDGGVDG